MAIIKFYGNLKQYGDKYKINAGTAQEALTCLYVQIKGLKQSITDGRFRVRINKHDINEQTLQFGLQSQIPQDAVIHIVPVVAGAKNSGAFQTILGAVMVVVGAFLSWTPIGAPLIAGGIGLMISGVAQMLTKTPKSDSSSEITKKSTSFSSLGNTIAQGSPIPLIYGKIMTGSKVLSQGIETMDTEA